MGLQVISGCLIMPDFERRFGTLGADGKYALDSSRQSIITSLLSAGTFVGALAQAFTSDSIGRKGSIVFWSTVFTIGTAIQTATNHSVAQITVGRFIAGLGVGAMSCLVPLYNGETAPKSIRGFLLVMYQMQIIIGYSCSVISLQDCTDVPPSIFISYLIDLGTHTINGSASWRIPVGLQMLWGLILISGIFFLPESPRHLLGHGRVDEARKVIAELNSARPDDSLVAEQLAELQAAIHAENDGGQATWAECFSTRNMLWKRTLNGMMLQFIQQLNGQNFYCRPSIC
jgi:SP family sugar:H+ symporter-like MFS transporter